MNDLTAARAFCVLVTGLACLMSTSARAQPENIEAMKRMGSRIELAQALARDGEPDRAHALMQEAIASDAYALIPDTARTIVHSIAGSIGMMSGHFESGHQDFVIATSMPGADASVWNARFRSAIVVDRLPDAAKSLEQLARAWPDAVDLLDPAAVSFALREARSRHPDSSDYMTLMEALAEAPLEASPPVVAQDYWPLYIATLIAEGEITRAATVTERVVHSTETLLGMSVDSRYTALYDPLSLQFNLARSLTLELQRERKHMHERPNSLWPVQQYVRLLRLAGLHEDALDILNSLPHDLAPGSGVGSGVGSGAGGWEDEADYLALTINEFARIYWDLGRHDEAIALLEKARRLPERGAPNVSQTLNLAGYYAFSEQPDKALALVDIVSGTSAYGDMVAASIRAMIAVQTNDTGQVGLQLAYLAEHRDVAPQIYEGILLLDGRLDAAAEVFIGRLNDLSTRFDALVSVQHYINDEDPASLTLIENLIMQNHLAMAARDDVRAAVDKVGRTMSVPFYR